MLKSIEFSNFKSWPTATLKFGQITGLFGTNSSGKTSLLQFLLLLKQTREATDRALSLEINGAYVSLGVFRDLIYNHDDTQALAWKLNWENDKEIAIADPSARKATTVTQSRNLAISGEVRVKSKSPESIRLAYSLGDLSFTLSPRDESAREFDLHCDGGDFRFIRTQGRAWPLPRPVKSYAYPDQARTYFQNASFLSDLETAYERQFDRIYYLGPLREYPQRDYLWAQSRPLDVGKKGERAVEAILAATADGEMRNIKYRSPKKAFQEIVAYWLKQLGLVHEFRVAEIGTASNRWQAYVTVQKGGAEALLTDVGFGISQVLPVITLLQYVPDGSTVILEQPEIHLHPLAQANLADAIVGAALHRNIQVIFESHSEHLLLRLQRRVAEEELSSKNVRLYFSNTVDGASKLTELRLNLLGQIDNWPSHFMGDAFGETFAAEVARLKRLKR